MPFRGFIVCVCLLMLCPAAGAERQAVPFAKGADLSLLQYIQDHGVQYREAGRVKDPLAIFQEHGVNFVRLRLFVNPDGTSGQVNSLPYTVALARRVKRAGFGFLLDIHYSDDWADPGHQQTPAAWRGLPHAQLVDHVYTYTRDTLTAFRRAKCLPDMVAVGNEITNGMLWPDGGPLSDSIKWDRFADLLNADVRGVRAADPQGVVKVMIHTDRGGSQGVSRQFYNNLQRRGVSFDVIGLSYYPFWHGTLADLAGNLAFLSQTYHKDIYVVETDYDWNGGEQKSLPFPLTPAGQKDFLTTLIQTVAATPGGHGRGVFYWAPEWIMGRKWYTPPDPGSGSWESRALFDHDGNMLPGMTAFETQPPKTEKRSDNDPKT